MRSSRHHAAAAAFATAQAFDELGNRSATRFSIIDVVGHKRRVRSAARKLGFATLCVYHITVWAIALENTANIDIGRDPSRLILGEQVDPEAPGELCSLSG
jgi:hypothetical protein